MGPRPEPCETLHERTKGIDNEEFIFIDEDILDINELNQLNLTLYIYII